MKKYHVFILVLSALLFSACGDKSDSPDSLEEAANQEPSAIRSTLEQAANSFMASVKEETPALKESVERIITNVVEEQDIPAVKELQEVAKMDILQPETFSSYQNFAGAVGEAVLPRNFTGSTQEIQTVVMDAIKGIKADDLKQIASNFQNLLSGDFQLSSEQRDLISNMLASYAPMLSDVEGLMDSAKGALRGIGG